MFIQKRKGRRRKREKVRKPVNTSLNFQGNFETTETLPTFRGFPSTEKHFAVTHDQCRNQEF